jgi:hypothetical protein
MARFKEHYTLYSRKNSKGKNVWYYRTYDEYGRRTSGKSTGEISKTKARQYCEDLYKDGRLLQGKEITLNVYSENCG